MENTVMPDYEHSILNLINSILHHYNVKTKYNGLPELDSVLSSNKYKNVVLIILDGMGEHILKGVSPDGFFVQNEAVKITSVSPSATTSAMTTYYSGKPPIETGWIAMSQYFKEYGRALEMLRRIDSYTGEKIINPQIDVFDLIKYVPIYQEIEDASPDVKAYEINPGFCDSRSKRNINADTVEMMCDLIKTVCTNPDRNFILAYNDNPDGLLHKYGCTSDEVKSFIQNAEQNIEKLIKDLEGTNTLVIISADHGHADIKTVYTATELEEIQDCLITPPSLESRFVSFWVKEDKKQKFEKLFNEKFNKEFILYTSKQVIESNLLGFGEQHKKIEDFLGNYVAVSIGNSIIKLGTQLAKEKKNKASTHCGLTPNEMEVPLILLK